jgi:hypothetical protein
MDKKINVYERPITISHNFPYKNWTKTTHFGNHMLGESRPKELYTEMPVIWLQPESNRKVPTEGIYDCPVYKTLTRAGM